MKKSAKIAQEAVARGGSIAPRLTLLGSFRLTDAVGAGISLSTKKNRALLAILALAPGGQVARERLCGLLWGDRGEEQARSSLRQSLAILRKELGAAASVLRSEDDHISLNFAMLSIDAVEVLSISRIDDPERFARAAELYQGDLLADLALREDTFEDWLRSERQRLTDAAIVVFERLAASGDASLRITYAKRLVTLDPMREASQRSMMLAYHAAGETGLALKQFDSCKAILAAEFRVPPAPETLELRARIVKGTAGAATQVKSADDALAEKKESALPQEPKPTVSVESIPSANVDTPDDSPGAGSTHDAVADRLSIAVLPFTNLSGDPNQFFFADGISEDIITGLARFKSLAVVARNSSFRFRGDVDVTEAAQVLDAQYIVEGSVRRTGGRLRISVQLIEATTAKHVWADSYDDPESDLFAVQDEVVQKITGTLVGQLAVASVYHTRLRPPDSLAAYELVLRANALNWESQEAKIKARGLLEAALRIDPYYATAHALMAAVALREAAYHGRLTRAALDVAFAYASKAVDIDPNDSACHSILGWVLLACKDTELAGEHLSRALQLNPNNPFAMVNRGSLLVQLGRPDEAIDWFLRATRIDPYFNPSWVQEKLALAHFTGRRYDLAANHLTRSARLRFYMHALAAACQNELGRQDATRNSLQKALSIRPDLSVELVVELLPCSRLEDENHLRKTLIAAGVPDEAISG
jgi:TolB-like protein/DNA-binding SARP family transcriptional activator/Tfp pilus assembly protein PilF